MQITIIFNCELVPRAAKYIFFVHIACCSGDIATVRLLLQPTVMPEVVTSLSAAYCIFQTLLFQQDEENSGKADLR